jgi:hypothetical protein
VADDQPDYDDIRARAEMRVRRRGALIRDFGIYVAANLFLTLVGLDRATAAHNYTVLLMAVFSWLGWGIWLAWRALNVYGMLDAMRERSIQREIEREIRRRALAENVKLVDKPKRKRLMRLSDDGELIPDDTESLHTQNAVRN